METFRRGEPITLVQQFWTIDPISKVSTPANPTGVVFIVEDPNGVKTTYTFGIDSNVTNLMTGTFVCQLDPPVPPGEYLWRCEGSGAVVAVFEGAFTVLESGVLPPDPATVPMPGPCSPWINGDEVAAAGPDLAGIGSNTWMLDDVAYVASHILYELSGRQFPGVCKRKVRPCRDSCSCWGSQPSIGLGPFYWTLSTWYGGAGWGWRNECGGSCGCGNESYIRLAGYPVREILEVKIDGNVLDPSGYRLDDRRNLIRKADISGPTPVDRVWPACQDLSLDDTEPGTYSVTYTWGADVPALGRLAAAQLARELWAVLDTGKCKLPSRVTRVVRQGIEYDKIVPTADLLREGTTGLPLVDAFIATVNPSKAKRRSVVWSPDLQPFARKVGQ